MRNYTYALILITSLILLATIVHNASADVQYYEEAWFLRNNTETIVDNVSAIVKTNDGIIHIKMNETYLNDYFNYVSAKSKEKERIREKWGMNDTEIRKTRAYPIHLYKKVYTKSENNSKEFNITLMDVSYKLKSQSVDLRTKNAYIDVKNIDIKNDDYVLKIGFHTITYDSGTNTITVTGFTEATPCTFQDIYDADVIGGWGVVTRQCNNQFCFGAKLQIGDGVNETWFADTNKEISHAIDTNFIYIPLGGHFRCGEIVDVNNRTTKDGCYIYTNSSDKNIIEFANGGTVELLSSTISSETKTRIQSTYGGSGHKIWNCNIIHTGISVTGKCPDVDFYNTNWQKNNEGVAFTSTYADDIIISDCDYATIWFGVSNPVTIKNYKIINEIYSFYCFGMNTDLCVIDSDGDWTIKWFFTNNGKIHRQYSFDLKVTDKEGGNINGATVKIWDKDSNLVVDTTTGADGTISTQTITRGYYNQANGDTLQDASPHLIKIEKAGYTTYETNFTIEEKTDWTISLNSAETKTETTFISTQVGAHKTTMAAAFMLLSGMFMMMAIKRRQEDE